MVDPFSQRTSNFLMSDAEQKMNKELLKKAQAELGLSISGTGL